MKTNNKKASMKSALTAVITLIVIAAVIAVNLLAGGLGSFMDLDVSEKNLYAISDTSRDFLDTLENKIDITVLSDDPDSRIVKFLTKYCALSDEITYECKSAAQNPELLAKYDTEGDCVVVSCPDTGKTKCVNFYDIAEYDTLRYAYYGEYIETAFDADSEMTNAISYVVSQKVYSVFYTQGHDETDFPNEVLSEMGKERMDVRSINLLKNGGIPDGCELIIINNPQADLAADELSMLQDYAASGGNIVVLLSSEYTGSVTNLATLAETAGITIGSGVVSDPGSCYQNEYLIFPQLGTTNNITRYVTSGINCLLYKARPVSISADASDSYRDDELFLTSEQGTATDIFGNETASGTILLGAYGRFTDGGSICLLPSSLIASTTIENYGNLANMQIFINALTENLEDSAAFVIPSVPLGTSHNAVASSTVYGVIAIGVLPAIVLVFGAVKCIIRKRR